MTTSARPHRLRRRLGPFLGRLLVGPLVLGLLFIAACEVVVLSTNGRPRIVPPAGNYLEIDGVRTHYETWGRAGSPIVLVPGFAESTYVWHAAAPLLARTHRVYAIDVRGYGYTERRPPYTLDADTVQLAGFLAALHLDAAHGSRPVLVGHSLGAAIVANLARTAPGSVAGIVLLDGDATPYGVGPTWAHRLIATDPYFTAALRLLLPSDRVVGSMVRSACGPGCPTDHATLERWRRPYEMPGADAATKAIAGAPLIGLTYAQLGTVHVPAAVMAGDLDPEMGRASMAATAARLHTHLTYRLAGARHLLMISDPTRFTAGLESLLARLPHD